MFDVFWICGLVLVPMFIVFAIVLFVFFLIAGPKKFMQEMKHTWQVFVSDLTRPQPRYNKR